MFNININERIKFFRKEISKNSKGKNYSQQQFADKIGVSKGVINNIENNLVDAKDNVIKLICLTFNVREDWIRNGVEPIFNKDKDEPNILTSLEKQGVRPVVLTLIEKYLNMSDMDKQLFDKYLYNFVNDLNSNSQKTEEELSITLDTNSSIDSTIEVKLYDLPLSAGTGTYLLDDIGYELISIDKRHYPSVDFALRISGDSMEPKYSHNDIIYIKSTPKVESGQIGVFYYNGEAYLKKLIIENKQIFLVSLNEKYKPIEIKNDTFKVVGAVL